MAVNVVALDSEVLVRVDGPLDGSQAPALHVAAEQALAGGATFVIVDLARVPALDGGGIAVLAALAHQLAGRGGRLVLQLPDGSAVEVDGARGLNDLLDVQDA
jgi:anti-anti-sigma factor